MKPITRRLNLFLALLALPLLCGCQTDKKDKEVSTLRVYLETVPDNFGSSQTISVLRADPMQITIGRDPVLSEANIVTAKVVAAGGGFAIQGQFDETSTLTLEQYTRGYEGKHLAIFGRWGTQVADARWLAAPLIKGRIADGILSFTPDMTRAEADRLVLGLTHVAKNNRKGQIK